MGQRHLSRVTVYNRALSDFSPGSILELEALRASFMAGDTESDFLMGSERYKFIYATHARWLAALGSEPLSTKALRVARGTVGNAIRNSRLYPGYKEVARRTSGTIRRVSRPRRGA
jgi:CelD/BcsL family acetyltransferase involved in cellulose biosynthesis